jgi:hypothetical protein
MSTYNYAHTDFLNDIFNEDSLKLAVASESEITAELDGITSKESVDEDGEPTGNIIVTFHFPVDLSAGEQTALDALVAAHTGAAPTVVKWHASSVLTDHEKAIEAVPDAWTELGGAVTTPDFFTPNVSACKGRVVGMCKTNGEGTKVRLKEDDTAPSGHYVLPDTSGEWQAMQWFSPDPPTAGTHSYTLEGQLPTSGATAASVKYVAVSLLEFS